MDGEGEEGRGKGDGKGERLSPFPSLPGKLKCPAYPIRVENIAKLECDMCTVQSKVAMCRYYRNVPLPLL